MSYIIVTPKQMANGEACATRAISMDVTTDDGVVSQKLTVLKKISPVTPGEPDEWALYGEPPKYILEHSKISLEELLHRLIDGLYANGLG